MRPQSGMKAIRISITVGPGGFSHCRFGRIWDIGCIATLAARHGKMALSSNGYLMDAGIKVIHGDGLDVPSIMDVMTGAFDPEYGEAWTSAQCLSTLSLPNAVLLIATCDDRVAGFTLSRWVADEEELLLIAVSKQYRRRGIAKKLLGILIDNARRANRLSIFLEVRESNIARSFYDEAGFVAIGKRTGYYKAIDGSRHDSITMAIKL
jgi:[ribosomal protein S18]-alanine N-acetyltransferase